MSLRRRILLAIGALFVSCTGYLALWPVPIDPVAWTPPPRTPWPVNAAAAGGTRLHPELPGPEAVAFDVAGRIVTGLADGRVVRFAADGSGEVEVLARTGGRPLGLKLDGERVLVADSPRGLLAIEAGQVKVLAAGHEGRSFKFADDLVVAPDGTIYFTDASDKFPVSQFTLDVLEHRPRGRVLAWDPKTGATRVVAAGLYMANGLALAPTGDHLIVAETTAYRLQRVWIAGERRGQVEPFGDYLPGFPDNVTWSPTRGVYWVAMGSPRNTQLEDMAGRPWLRKVVVRLPEALHPAPARHTWVVAVDESGRVVHDLQHAGAGAYALAASAIERDGWLYLGSFRSGGIYRIAAPALPAAAAAP